MPWHIGKHDDCNKPFAVIKDDDESLAGCHDTEEAAKRQLAALYANEGQSTDMHQKSVQLVDAKAFGDEGEFTALASVFNNVDLVGDRILPGAFKNTLRKWRASQKPIPIVSAHNWDDPMAHIGIADPRDVKETDRGLEVKAQLDIDDNPLAKQVHKLMKRRSLTAFSFGYTVPLGGQKAAEDANEISEVDLVEIGPCLKGANPEAQLQEVKSALAETAPSADALRRRSTEVERELISEKLVEAEPTPPQPDPFDEVRATMDELDWSEEARAEFQREVKSALDEKLKGDSAEGGVDPKDVPAEEVEDGANKEPEGAKSRPQDPLRKRAEEVLLEVASDGLSLRKPPEVKQEEAPEPSSEDELKRVSRDLELQILTD